MKQHLICYDGTCGMCHRAVQFVLKHDKKKRFVFAPLQGETAANLLREGRNLRPDVDAIVLIENYQQSDKAFYQSGKAALRICWLLGGAWKLLGIVSFFPGWLYNWVYRIIAANRFKWFGKESCLIPINEDQSRFLP